MQCVLQCPTAEMITQKETGGEYLYTSFLTLFQSLPLFQHLLHAARLSCGSAENIFRSTFQLKSCSRAVKSIRGLCAGKNTQAWWAMTMAWSLLAEKSKWSASLHFLKLSVPVNTGCLDAGSPLLHVQNQKCVQKKKKKKAMGTYWSC